ncbi:HU family DNA-binding protein [Paenibacillus sp. Dod16]|uniref:HU family DNA-binding protein n=1 Tax=Paenibacillus sp. Dod16 TaxID=3416392 RepID=UPI003CF049A1
MRKNKNVRDDELEQEDKANTKKYGDGVERKQNYIIQVAADESGIHPDTVKTSFDACWAVIQNELEMGNWVKLHGKGTFYLSRRKKRIGRNPATGEEHEVPEREAMAFQTSSAYGKYLREVRAKRSREMKKKKGKSGQNE